MQLNPWLSIWTQTRATMRQALEGTRNGVMIFWLIFAGSFAFALNRAATKSTGDEMPLSYMFLLVLVSSFIGVAIYYYVVSWLLKWIGGWFGGQGDVSDMRLVIAISSIPSVYILGIWVIQLLLFGSENFTSVTPLIDQSPLLLVLFIGTGLIQLVLGIWAFVIFCKCVGEAHRFSAWKGLLTVVMPYVLFFGVIVLISLVAMG